MSAVAGGGRGLLHLTVGPYDILLDLDRVREVLDHADVGAVSGDWCARRGQSLRVVHGRSLLGLDPAPWDVAVVYGAGGDEEPVLLTADATQGILTVPDGAATPLGCGDDRLRELVDWVYLSPKTSLVSLHLQPRWSDVVARDAAVAEAAHS